MLFASFLALLWMIWSGLTVMLPDNSDEKCECPSAFFVIGHRGLSDKAPENTVPAFEMGAEATGYIQLDVGMTMDGQLVTVHDDYVDRTTDGHGIVCRMTWAELQKLDAGEWFSAKYTGTHIPSLAQAFSALGNNSRYLLNLRKRQCENPDGTEGQITRDVLVRATVAKVKEYGLQSKVVFEVEEKETADDLKKLLPSSMVLASVNVLYTLSPLARMWEFVDGTHADGVSAHYLMPLLKGTMLSEAHERNLKVFIHTVDSMYVSRWLECLGVDAVISNSPEKLMQVSKCPITGANGDESLPYSTRKFLDRKSVV